MDGLATIGYEGASLEAFLGTLQAAGVGLLLDVREAPVSRRREFAKKALSAAVEQAGIAYRHEGALGAPKPLRDAIKQGECSAEAFFAHYEEHLAAQAPLLDRLAAELPGRVALMCYERDVRQCHRKTVAHALQARTGLTPQHLRPERDGDARQLDLQLPE